MKFALEPYKRRVAKGTQHVLDSDLIKDVQRVAVLLKQNTVTKEDYQKHGAYSVHALHNRFGGWLNLLNACGLPPSRSRLDIPDTELVQDIARVAKSLGKASLTRNEYNLDGKFSASTVKTRLGSWFNALEAAGLKKTRTLGVTTEEYFKNLEEVWIKLGRQPRYAEMTKQVSKYSAGAYEDRFGTWRKALGAFVAYINQEQTEESNATDKHALQPIGPARQEKPSNMSPKNPMTAKSKRQVSDRLRFLVMRRDNYRCSICGRSPATDAGTELVIDHIVPWSKGGETVFKNLQTLCRGCNAGKGDLGQI